MPCPKCFSTETINLKKGFIEDRRICKTCNHVFAVLGSGVKTTGLVVGALAIVAGGIFAFNDGPQPRDPMAG
jgi:hypothetical protein